MEEKVTPKKGIPLLITNFTRAEAEQIINEANTDSRWGSPKVVLEKYHLSRWDLIMLAKAYGLELKRMRKKFVSDPDNQPLKLPHSSNGSAVAVAGEVKPRKRHKKIWRRHGKYSAEGYKRLVLAARRNARKRRVLTPGAARLLPGVTAKAVVPKQGEIAFQVTDLEKRLAIAEAFKKDILALVSKYARS